MSDHVFVYGTLLSTIPSAASKWLSENAQLCEQASFPGVLYDLGSYPGFVLGEKIVGAVVGEIHRLSERESALDCLDKYEGLDEEPPLYKRELLLHPKYGEVWTYTYQGETKGLSLIPGGNYLNYCKKQAKHRLFIGSVRK
ncbi:MAG: gamma-glutamylcyclotransferase family protein [Lewinella sp.]|uniref:gamma-glutamylcyclotransferase family protein n=1 Tax=Lewinella sp. TaxID=2004506 RepID=UPI003D6AAF52